MLFQEVKEQIFKLPPSDRLALVSCFRTVEWVEERNLFPYRLNAC
jgi:hypothetical protein